MRSAGVENGISRYDLEYNNIKHYSHLRHSLELEYVETASKRATDFLDASAKILKENPDLVIIAVAHGCFPLFLKQVFDMNLNKFHYCGINKFVWNPERQKLEMAYFNKKVY